MSTNRSGNTGLHRVARNCVGTGASRGRSFLAIREQESERVAQRCIAKLRAVGVRAVAFPEACDRFGRRLVCAFGGALRARAVLVELRVPDICAFEEPRGKVLDSADQVELGAAHARSTFRMT